VRLKKHFENVDPLAFIPSENAQIVIKRLQDFVDKTIPGPETQRVD